MVTKSTVHWLVQALKRTVGKKVSALEGMSANINSTLQNKTSLRTNRLEIVQNALEVIP